MIWVAGKIWAASKGLVDMGFQEKNVIQVWLKGVMDHRVWIMTMMV